VIKMAIRIFMILIGVWFVAATAITISNEEILATFILLIPGLLLLFFGIKGFCKQWKVLSAKIKEEKEQGVGKTKKRVVRWFVITPCVLFACYVVFAFVSCYSSATDINLKMQEVIKLPIERSSAGEISTMDHLLENCDILERVFIERAEYDAYRERYDSYLIGQAGVYTEKISKLVPVTAIADRNEFIRYNKLVEELTLNENNSFEGLVRKHVSNYAQFEQFVSQYESVLERYRTTCARCSGAGTKKCSRCNGSGSELVKWYSHGDWGEVSYTKSNCGSCGGSGRDDCGCDGGYQYIFGK